MGEEAVAYQLFEVNILPTADIHQVNIRVKDPKGKPLPGAKARVYRAFNPLELLPIKIVPSLVNETVTDADGYAYFDDLWPWAYAIEVTHEELDLHGAPILFNVELLEADKKFTFNVKTRKPPITYELRVQLGLGIADIAAWLTNNLPLLSDAVLNANGIFDSAKAEEGWLIIRFKIEKSPGWIAIVIAILAILILLGFILWQVKEILPKIPKPVLYALGIGAAAGGMGLAAYAFTRRKR